MSPPTYARTIPLVEDTASFSVGPIARRVDPIVSFILLPADASVGDIVYARELMLHFLWQVHPIHELLLLLAFFVAVRVAVSIFMIPVMVVTLSV